MKSNVAGRAKSRGGRRALLKSDSKLMISRSGAISTGRSTHPDVLFLYLFQLFLSHDCRERSRFNRSSAVDMRSDNQYTAKVSSSVPQSPHLRYLRSMRVSDQNTTTKGGLRLHLGRGAPAQSFHHCTRSRRARFHFLGPGLDTASSFDSGEIHLSLELRLWLLSGFTSRTASVMRSCEFVIISPWFPSLWRMFSFRRPGPSTDSWKPPTFLMVHPGFGDILPGVNAGASYSRWDICWFTIQPVLSGRTVRSRSNRCGRWLPHGRYSILSVRTRSYLWRMFSAPLQSHWLANSTRRTHVQSTFDTV